MTEYKQVNIPLSDGQLKKLNRSIEKIVKLH